jgi:E3 ubiquitin-protein ligase EDD1
LFFLKQFLRQGVFDVLPQDSLDSLTAEDFRLLLNGVNEINVQQLIDWTSFNEENGKSFHFLISLKI